MRMTDHKNGNYIETSPAHEIKAQTRGGFGISRAEQPTLAYPGRKFQPQEEYLSKYGDSEDGTGLHEVLSRVYKAARADQKSHISMNDITLLMDWAWSLHLDTIRLEQTVLRYQDALEEASC